MKIKYFKIRRVVIIGKRTEEERIKALEFLGRNNYILTYMNPYKKDLTRFKIIGEKQL